MSSRASSWETGIADVGADDVVVRGYPLSELVGAVTFVDVVFLVHTGELPTQERRRMLDAIFVALIEHGISPSTMLARQLASCGTPVQAAVAGGVLSIADWHGGSGEQLAEVLAAAVADCSGAGDDDAPEALRARAQQIVQAHEAKRSRLPGFGHPQHPEGDPRAAMLLDLGDDLAVTGRHVALLRLLVDEIERSRSRRLPANVTGAVAALLLDLGFSWRATRGMVITPRSAGLTAHVIEELEQGGRWRHAPADEVSYHGPARRSLDRPPQSN